MFLLLYFIASLTNPSENAITTKDTIIPNSLDETLLGKQTHYPKTYSPKLLCAIPRELNRKELNFSGISHFYGFDLWHAYELSWLNTKGKPIVAMAEFIIPLHSPFLVESKSLKLYLNSFNETRFNNTEEVIATLKKDLTAALNSDIQIKIFEPKEWNLFTPPSTASFQLLDDLDVSIDCYEVDASILTTETISTKEILGSHLLKSNCPITNQPDWASIYIQYSGVKINHASLLKYIISFRNHNEFHEHCVERIFVDLMQRCHPEELTVTARFTRRGGLDINPCRSTHSQLAPFHRREHRQ